MTKGTKRRTLLRTIAAFTVLVGCTGEITEDTNDDESTGTA